MSTEAEFSRQICRALDQGARTLDADIAERLRAARERALQQVPVMIETHTLVGAGGAARLGLGGTGRNGHDDHAHPIRTLLAIMGLILGVFIAYHWNGFLQAGENEEIDSALLADDLPPKAYLDQGFQAWLDKNSSRAE